MTKLIKFNAPKKLFSYEVEKLPFYCVFVDGYNFGYSDLADALETIQDSIAGATEETVEITVTRALMTQKEFDELEEVEL